MEQEIEIKQKLAEAIENAPEEKVFKEHKEYEDNLALAFLEGHINSDEQEWLWEHHEIPGGVATFDTLEEFRRAMELLGLDQETIDEMYQHEEEHFLADQKNGRSPKILIQFTKLDKGGLAFVPSVFSKYDDEDDEVQRQQIRDTLNAATSPSDSDKRKLGIEQEGDEKLKE